MKWFNKWIRKQVKKAVKAEHEERYNDSRAYPASTECIKAHTGVEMDHRTAINLKMQHAYGGTIIEISNYDDHKDQWNRDLYIINDSQDLASEISSILVQHNLRNS